MTYLSELWLFHNDFSCDILPLRNLIQLSRLWLSFNSFSGDIASLSSLTRLTSLDTEACYFTGNITSFHNLTQLTELYLEHNFLSGPIDSVSSLTFLTRLFLYDNVFSLSLDCSHIISGEDEEYWERVREVIIDEAKKSAEATVTVVGYLKPAWNEVGRRRRSTNVQRTKDPEHDAKETIRKQLSALSSFTVKAVFKPGSALSPFVIGFAAMHTPPVTLTSAEAAAILLELPNAKPKYSMQDKDLCHAYPEWLSANGVKLFEGLIANECKNRAGKKAKAFTNNLRGTPVPTVDYPKKGVQSIFLVSEAVVEEREAVVEEVEDLEKEIDGEEGHADGDQKESVVNL